MSPVGEEETEKAGEKREKGETEGKKGEGWNWRRGGNEPAGGEGGGKDEEGSWGRERLRSVILSSEEEERMRKQEIGFKGRMKGGGNGSRWENERKEKG